MEAVIERFLAVEPLISDGYGYGDGYGDGDVKTFNGSTVYDIDGIQTLIKKVKGNLATGFILQADLKIKKCFVARVGDKFAHGETAQKAVSDAQAKHFEDLDPEERIAEFWKQFKLGESYPGSEFFDWHFKLTGSCEMGRTQFVEDRGIDLTRSFTVQEFVELVKNSYGNEITNRLMEDK